MKLDITQEHIDKGIRGSFESCPIALAAKKECPGKRIHINSATIRAYDITDDNDRETGLIYWLPVAARDFIQAFDGREPVKPFSFEITEEPEPISH